jgi:hypothetical protein
VARGAYKGNVFSPAGAFAAPGLNGQVFRRKNLSDNRSGIERLVGPGRAITFRSEEVFSAATDAFQPRFFESAYRGLSKALG